MSNFEIGHDYAAWTPKDANNNRPAKKNSSGFAIGHDYAAVQPRRAGSTTATGYDYANAEELFGSKPPRKQRSASVAEYSPSRGVVSVKGRIYDKATPNKPRSMSTDVRIKSPVAIGFDYASMDDLSLSSQSNDDVSKGRRRTSSKNYHNNNSNKNSIDQGISDAQIAVQMSKSIEEYCIPKSRKDSSLDPPRDLGPVAKCNAEVWDASEYDGPVYHSPNECKQGYIITKPWYHEISRQEAEERLCKTRATGAASINSNLFLVRPKEESDSYAVSVLSNPEERRNGTTNDITHHLIQRAVKKSGAAGSHFVINNNIRLRNCRTLFAVLWEFSKPDSTRLPELQGLSGLPLNEYCVVPMTNRESNDVFSG
eukprot:m.114426 g.114426  ORF g.114426 m.114426 type:complete len:369 (-) comp14166_c0_seq1:3512-4618(-)